MKKVLVTGATGFIGNFVVQELLHRQYEVIATSASIAKAQQKPWFDRVSFKPMHLEKWDASVNYYDFFDAPDCMIHLAWEGLPNYQDDFHITINLPRHKAFIENMIGNGLKDISITGTCLEYGKQEGCLSEDMPVYPSSSYAIAKNELRKYAELLKDKYLFHFKWIRLFYMFGEGQNPKSLFSQLEKAVYNGDLSFNMSAGEQIRDYLPVEMVAEYIVRIATQQKVTDIINCCSGTPVTIRNLVEEYLKKKNRTIHLNLGHYSYPDYEPMSFWGDNSKLKSITGND